MKMKAVYTPIDGRPRIDLTIGKTYEVLETLQTDQNFPSVEHYYQIQDDKGDQHSYRTENFTELSEWRKNQIEEILKIN